jgi:hypothetical protein
MLSSYGLVEPSGMARSETAPPRSTTVSAMRLTASGGNSPSSGRMPMPSWDARKLKNVVPAGGGSSAAGPGRQRAGVAGLEGVLDQRRQRELVDQMGFGRARRRNRRRSRHVAHWFR